jgi:soluble lytic murein transglycosylase
MKLTALASGLTVFTALLSCAPGRAAETPLSDLGQGITAWNARDFKGTVAHLKGREIPHLADYVTYYLASADQQTTDYDDALRVLTAYRQKPIESSPLAGKISVLHARVLLDKRDPASTAKALDILQTDRKFLPQPDGDFALALTYEAQGEKQQAAITYQGVYYAYPNTDLAAQSWTGMERLKTAMASDYPKATPRQKLDRCAKWLDAKQYHAARIEYAQLADSLTGLEKDEARIGISVADYMAGDARAAYRELKTFHAPKSEIEAERLYYMTESARKADDDREMRDALKQLDEHYPKSPWRLKALVAGGNHFLFVNDREEYTPLFKAAYETFPPDTPTAYSHWKVTWDAFLDRKPERMSLLKEQVEKYPIDGYASSALYFLARTAESDSKPAEARAYYDKLDAQYPHFYYGVLARERLKELKTTEPDQEALNWLNSITWPEHRDFTATEPNAATRARLERSRMLTLAGLSDLSESELRYGAKIPAEQPQLLALDLAAGAESPFRALRIMKSFSSDYLSMPTAGAAPKFWQMLFPLPYRDDVFKNATERGLDPYHVAALIRQESEFNPGAKSHANAWGLMQLIPSTGKMLGRQQGLGVVRAPMLLEPALNIRLGTQYLRDQLNNWENDWYKTLAAYNAGPGRVKQWLTWSQFKEPAEFVESIPFTETREYVQAVLRNADMYRELYSGKPAPPATAPPVSLKTAAVIVKKPAPTAARKTTTRKKNPA